MAVTRWGSYEEVGHPDDGTPSRTRIRLQPNRVNPTREELRGWPAPCDDVQALGLMAFASVETDSNTNYDNTADGIAQFARDLCKALAAMCRTGIDHKAVLIWQQPRPLGGTSPLRPPYPSASEVPSTVTLYPGTHGGVTASFPTGEFAPPTLAEFQAIFNNDFASLFGSGTGSKPGRLLFTAASSLDDPATTDDIDGFRTWLAANYPHVDASLPPRSGVGEYWGSMADYLLDRRTW